MVSRRGDGGPRLYVEVERCEPATDGDSPTGVVRARGEVDLSTVERLADCLDPGLWSECEGLLLDLSEVNFIDSTGLSALVVADKSLGGEGLRLAIATEPRSQVEGLLELTGLRRRIPDSL
jgi:anti-sigma B factor antagonist